MPAQADSRAASYSIHMLAKILPRCTMRNTDRFIRLTRETADGEEIVDRGRARFRVECNIPYAIEVGHKATRWVARGRTIPTATLSQEARLPNSLTTHDTDGQLSCRLQHRDTEQPCATTGSDTTRPVLPRAEGQIDIQQTERIPTTNESAHSDSLRIVAVEVGGRL
jgi:hypothetical protein